jgi:hypothetical protein
MRTLSLPSSLLAVCVAIMATITEPQVAAAEMTVDTCKTVDTWLFSNGNEFPGASGQLNATPDGLAMSWNFSKGGAYVAATIRSTSPVNVTSFTLTVSADAACTAAIRLRDVSGRTFQSPFITIPAGKSTLTREVSGPWGSSWGGNAGSGAAPIMPVGLTLVVDKRKGTPVVGQVLISKVTAVVSATAAH